MARVPPSTRKPGGTVPVPPPSPKLKKGEEMEILLPFPFCTAWRKFGLDRLIKKGAGRYGNSTALRALRNHLKQRQDCLRIDLKGKRLMVKKNALLAELEAAILGSPEALFDVEMVLNSKKEKGLLKYLVLWSDFPLEFASWVEAEELAKCKPCVKKFHKTFKGKAGEPRFNKHDVLGDIKWNKDDDAESVDEDGNPKEPDDSIVDPNIHPMLQSGRPSLGAGGELAAEMRLLPPTPKVKKAPVEGSRKSARTPVPKYETLNDRALSSGKAKMVKVAAGGDANADVDANAGADGDADGDTDDEVIPVTHTPAARQRQRRTTGGLSLVVNHNGRARISAVGEFVDSNCDESDEEDIVMQTTPTKTGGRKRARGGKENESDADSESESEERFRKKMKAAAAGGSKTNFKSGATRPQIESDANAKLSQLMRRRDKIPTPGGSGPNRKSAADRAARVERAETPDFGGDGAAAATEAERDMRHTEDYARQALIAVNAGNAGYSVVDGRDFDYGDANQDGDDNEEVEDDDQDNTEYAESVESERISPQSPPPSSVISEEL